MFFYVSRGTQYLPVLSIVGWKDNLTDSTGMIFWLFRTEETVKSTNSGKNLSTVYVSTPPPPSFVCFTDKRIGLSLLGGEAYAEFIFERFDYNITWIEASDVNMRQIYSHAWWHGNILAYMSLLYGDRKPIGQLWLASTAYQKFHSCKAC